MQRRTFLRLMCSAGLASGAVLAGCSQKKPLTVVVPFAPGGGGDVLARLVMQPVEPLISRPVVFVNRPGAGGNVGTRAVARAGGAEPLFGYATNGILCVNPHLYGTRDAAPFDPVAELKAVAAFTRMPLVMALNTRAIAGVEDFESLLAYARANPGALAWASAGVGTTSHIAGEIFQKLSGISTNHIPHAGGAAAAKEVLAGRIPFFIDVAPNVLPLVRDARLKPLAVTSKTRSALLPDVPTMAERGLEDFNLFAWDGLMASKTMPEDMVNMVHEAAGRVLSDERIKERLARLGAEPMPMTREEFSQFIALEAPRWERFVKTFAPPEDSDGRQSPA